MRLDTISLCSSLKEQADETRLWIDYGLEINGQQEYAEFPINLQQLIKSCQMDGDFAIYTCGCGIAGCAGIERGIVVTHAPDTIAWACPDPMSYRDQSIDASGSGVRYFQFAADQYVDAVDTGLKAIKSLAITSPSEVEFSVYGVKLDNVLALDTKVFSAHWQNPDKRLIAKSVRIDGDWIYVNGMVFDISDLCLPPELVALYTEFTTRCPYCYPKPLPQTEELIPAYQEYLQAGRRFCRALRRFLRSGAKVGLVYRPPDVLNSDASEICELFQ